MACARAVARRCPAPHDGVDSTINVPSARIVFLGTGTPIGQGGLHQACILVETHEYKVLLDCGMTALTSLGRAGIDPSEIDAVVISHLHGDHFGGLPLLILDATQRGRSNPLTIAGPPSTRERVEAALDIFGWTSARIEVAEFVVLEPHRPIRVAGVEITAVPVTHNPATLPCGVRLSIGETTISYSGDAGWSAALEELASGADVFICGVWSFDTPDERFVDLATLLSNRDRLQCKRLILTHLGPDLLERSAEVPVEVATDGLTIQL